MALKSGKKKMSRKLKRTIRKALSGVCLASALVVALIPATPTRAAVDPVYTTSTVKYDYGVEDTDETDLSVLDTNLVGIDLDKLTTDPTTQTWETKTVTQLSDGAYEIMWQFEVYTIGGRGIISRYNSLYNKGELEIKASLPLDYMVVETAFYDAFFAAHTAAKTAGNNSATIQRNPDSATPTVSVKSNYHLSTIEANPSLGSDQDVAALYWPTDYANYKAEYDSWYDQKQRHIAEQAVWDDWNTHFQRFQNGLEEDPGAAPSVTADPGAAPEHDFWVADMQLNMKNKFFCEGQPYFNDELGGTAMARTYELTSVIDSRNGAQTPQQFVWMPQGVPNADAYHNRKNDALGFVGSSWTAILGIGDRAFANTSNVTSLKLAGELKYIGDEAFANSFVESINFANVEDIGNRAYKNCTKLKNITLSDATVNIGTEAFYGCNSLTSLALPQSISYIGPGAFADCTALANLDLSAINQSNCDIDDYAFYDCIALSNVEFSDKINRIGNAAFAVNKGVTGTLATFTFPDHITGSHTCKLHTTAKNGIGNFVLAGRTNLRVVNMPADYGRTAPVTLPCGVFYNCINLQSVTFPNDGGGSCGFVTFEKVGTGTDQRTIFDTIQTQEFRVYGPGTNSAGQVASPRKSTWGLKSGLGNDVPYIYTDASGEHVEISQEGYIFIIDENGVLLSCISSDPQNPATEIAEMRIPTYVGDKKVTGIASDCFASREGQDVLNAIKSLVIADDTISEIASNAFAGCAKLEKVKIGNSVTKIGESAFLNCPKLTEVTIGSGVTEIGNAAFKGCNLLTKVNFDSPKGGYSSFPLSGIGAEAFSTGASKLTFEGDINEEYGPFQWAMQIDNFVDERNGTRVCYTTGFPDFQTVIVDNRNGLPTLVDYLHYDQIDAIDTALSLNPGETAHTLTERYNKLGDEEFDSAGNVTYTYSINNDETKLVNAALHLIVPSGVKSIDVNGFMNNTSPLGEGFSSVASNSNNVSTYLLAGPYYASYKSVTPSDIGGGGLFKNYYGTEPGTSGTGSKREYPNDTEGQKKEKEDIGNDRLLSVKLNNVEYLPDYAFYSCENLADINLGSALTKMGDAPFTGCTSLTGIGSNTNNFVCQNGIVYSENADGTYNIVEVLSTRGVKVGSKKIGISEADPYLANVSNILDGAFENCDGITNVDFTGMTLLKSIPDNCFRDCDLLNQVVLPDNVSIIGHNAFAGCMEGIELVCYSKEVFLPFDAFGTDLGNNKVQSKRVISYSDSAARKSGADLGADVTEVLDEKVRVKFVDYDYTTPLSNDIYLVKGSGLALDQIPDDPVREGYKFTGWKPDIKTKFNEDTTIVAQYELVSNNSGNGGQGGNGNGGSGSESGNNSGNGSGNGSSSETPVFYTLTVTNGNGSGSYAAGATVIITCTNPPSGYVFDKWKAGSDDLGIASVNVAATTLKMPAHEASVEATFKKAPTSTSGSGSSSGSKNNGSSAVKNGNSVVISKPGISNTDLAYARVSGSTDNYVVRIAETSSATAAVEKALTKEYGSLEGIRYSAMDITLYDSTGSTRITDYSGLSIQITIPIPDTMTAYAGNNKVAGVVNEKLDKLKPKFTTIDGVPCVTFTATHFSPYTIYVDTGNIIEGTSDETPKTGDINPKWFLVFGLAALGIALFFIKDKKPIVSQPAIS